MEEVDEALQPDEETEVGLELAEEFERCEADGSFASNT